MTQSVRPITASMIQKGTYYEKSNRPGWLRLFLGLDSFGNGIYADFTGVGACNIENLARWSGASYSEAEAREKFPDECAKIDKVTARLKEREGRMVKYVDKDELKALWRVLERLQADVTRNPDGWYWEEEEKAALITVMDAVLDTQMMADEKPLRDQREPGH
jgi:hypothetical protein